MSDRLVAAPDAHGILHLRWVPEGQRANGAREARERLKSVVNSAIRALPDGNDDALEMLFPEQFTEDFAPDAPALTAGMLVPLAQTLADRLQMYASPPSVTVSMPLKPENKGQLIPFLCQVSPGGFLSARRVNSNQLVLTSRLVHTPGEPEKLAKKLLVDFFDNNRAVLAEFGPTMPQEQRRDILQDFVEKPLTAEVASSLLENITVMSEDHRLSKEFDASGKPGPTLGKPGRTPTEVIAWLVDSADAAGVSATGGLKTLLDGLAQSAKNYWLGDRLDTASTIDFLTNRRDQLRLMQRPMTERIANAIQEKIDELRSHGPNGPAPTRLHDNVNGRVWESAFAETLAETPSRAMLEASTDVRKLMLGVFSRCTPAQKKVITEDALGLVESAYPGSWLNADPDFARWQENPSSVGRLERFLKTPATDGPSCMSTYLVGCRLLSAIGDEAQDMATWKAASDKAYAHVEDERGEDKFPDDDYKSGPDAGLQMRHQLSPDFTTYEDDDVRGVLSSVRDFDKRTDSMNASLNTGRPAIWGLSGTTNLILHFLKDPSVQALAGRNIPDLDHTILGIATMVMRDGGHSLREVLSVAANVVGPLPPPSLPQGQSLRDPASHYEGFFQRFYRDQETGMLLANAKEQAWRTTLDYRRGMRAA